MSAGGRENGKKRIRVRIEKEKNASCKLTVVIALKNKEQKMYTYFMANRTESVLSWITVEATT